MPPILQINGTDSGHSGRNGVSGIQQELRITPGSGELPSHIRTLRAREGTDFVVVLSHRAFPQDVKLDSEVGGMVAIVTTPGGPKHYGPNRRDIEGVGNPCSRALLCRPPLRKC